MSNSSLTIKINGDIKDYQNSLQNIQKETSKLQDSLSSVAKKSAIAFAGLTAAIMGSIAAYREDEQQQIRTEQIIKSTGNAAGLTAQQVYKMAASFQNVTTFGDDAILSGQNLLLTFKNIGADIFPAVTEAMLDMSTTMGTDLKGSAIQLGKALNDPTQGLAALTRVGVTFSEEQKKQIESMQRMGNIAGAQAIILKELQSEFGGTARAAAGGTGQLIQLKNTIGDIYEDIGKALLPTVLSLTDKLKGLFTYLRDNQEFASMAASVLAWGAAITGSIAAVAAAGVVILKLSAIIGALSAVFLPATVAASSFWIALTGPIGIAVAGIAAVTAAVVGLSMALRKTDDSASSIEKLDEKIAKLKKTRDAMNDSWKNDVFADPGMLSRINNIDKEIAGLEALKNKKVEVNATEQKVHEEAKARQAEKQEMAANLVSNNKEEFEARLQSINNQKALNEEQFAKWQEEQAIKAQQEEINKATQLEAEGRHTEAMNALETIKADHLIKESEKAIAQSKKEADEQRKNSQIKTTIAQNFISAGITMSKQGSSEMKALQSLSAMISTYQAAAAALAPPPIGAGPLLGPVLAASTIAMGLANVAAINSAKFADGGVFTGGIAGVDSIPALVQRKEIIAPVKSYDEVIEGAIQQRGYVKEGGSSGGSVDVNISLVSNFMDILEAKIIERRAIGVSRI